MHLPLESLPPYVEPGTTTTRCGRELVAVLGKNCKECALVHDNCSDIKCAKIIWLDVLDAVTKRLTK